MAYKGYINKAVQVMYGIPYNQLTAEQKKILHADSVRRAKLISEVQQEVLKNNLKAFDDEARMEKVLASIYSECRRNILASVTETIASVNKAGGEWSYANQSALTRSKGLFEQIAGELAKLGQKEQDIFTKGLSEIYTDQFMRQVYQLGQTISVKANFNRLNPALVKKTIDYPWSGAMFSDRLWTDKEKLGKNLRIGLTQSMILGESIPKITERIRKNIDTSQYNAERVARTETKRVTYVAHDDAYKDMGVNELKYQCANGVDDRTCPICKADHGKLFTRGKEPTLPRHPNCRCVYIPVVSDEFGDNELNELTGSIRGAENYEKWKIEQDEQLKQAKLIKEAEDKEAEVEDAVFNLAYLVKSGGTNGAGEYEGIWKDSVTLKDYADKKDKIQAKKDYFENQLKNSTGADYDKFKGLLTSLDEFEQKGQEYEIQAKKVAVLKKELEQAQKKAGIWVDDPYSQERKDNAYWFKSTQDADTVLRGVCGKVWKKAKNEEKGAIFGYTQGSGGFNRPLSGFQKPYYEGGTGWEPKFFKGVGKVWIDYEGRGADIKAMTTLIDRSSYDFDMWLQRGCDENAIESFLGIPFGKLSNLSHSDLQKYIDHKAIIPSFVSTGVSKGSGFGYKPVIMNIYAPKGTKMIYAEPFSYYSGAEYSHSSPLSWDGKIKQKHFGSESEMIIQRGATYIVKKIEKTGGKIYIDLEVHPESGYNRFQQRGGWKGSTDKYK